MLRAHVCPAAPEDCQCAKRSVGMDTADGVATASHSVEANRCRCGSPSVRPERGHVVSGHPCPRMPRPRGVPSGDHACQEVLRISVWTSPMPSTVGETPGDGVFGNTSELWQQNRQGVPASTVLHINIIGLFLPLCCLAQPGSHSSSRRRVFSQVCASTPPTAMTPARQRARSSGTRSVASTWRNVTHRTASVPSRRRGRTRRDPWRPRPHA